MPVRMHACSPCNHPVRHCERWQAIYIHMHSAIARLQLHAVRQPGPTRVRVRGKFAEYFIQSSNIYCTPRARAHTSTCLHFLRVRTQRRNACKNTLRDSTNRKLFRIPVCCWSVTNVNVNRRAHELLRLVSLPYVLSFIPRTLVLNKKGAVGNKGVC